MTVPRASAFADDIIELLGRRLIANLATINRDGSVHLVAIWFAVHGNQIIMPTSSTSQKVMNIRRTGRATVMVHQSHAGLQVRGVMLMGVADVITGADAGALNRSIHARYLMRDALALPSVQRYLAMDDATLRLTPDRTVAWDHRGEDASQECARLGLGLPLDT